MALPKIEPYDLPIEASLPKARAPFVPERHRLALLVHDMQNYFLAAYGDDNPTLNTVIANIAALVAACRAHDIPVLYTAQNGNQDRRDRGLQAELWGPGMRTDPAHQAITPALVPTENDIVLVKHRYSAFQRSNLADLLRVRGRDQLMVTGVYAHIGCLSTIGEAFQRDIEPFLAADASADFSRERHDMAVDWVAACSGVPLSTRQLLAAIKEG